MKDYQYRNLDVIKAAEQEMKKCKHPYVGTEHLMLALLKIDCVKEICDKYKLTYNSFKKELLSVVGSSSRESDFYLHTPLLKIVVSDALEDLEELNDKTLLPQMLMISLLESGDGIAVRILLNMEIKIELLYKDFKSSLNYSDFKYDFGINLTEKVSLNDCVIGREKELREVMEVLLRKNKCNPLLIGYAGVGKTAIVEELARRIKTGKVVDKLKDNIILSIEMSSLVAGTKYRGEFEEKIKNLIDLVVNNPKVILFIDEIHTIVNAGGSEGAIDAANILKPYLSRGDLKIIGATTINEYNKYIKKDKALERRFQVIRVNEPSVDETKDILLKCKKSFEKHYNVVITKNNVDDFVNLTNKFIKYKKNPDKTLEVVDSVCSKLYLNESLDKLKIRKSDILDYLENLCNIRSKDFEGLSEYLNERLVGQENAIKKVVMNLKNLDRCSMLFCGNSGVGKTKCVQYISEKLNIPLIRIDMNEYVNESSVSKLIGVSQGYAGYDDEFILEKVRFNPNCILLLDEVEKASRKVLNIFLNVLDDGYLLDSKGEIIDFSHAIIIMTSNLKKESSVGFFEKSSSNKFFSDEFLARLDDIIYFNDINEEVIENYLKRKKSKILVSEIKENCDFKRLGFRSINRYIRNKEKV